MRTEFYTQHKNLSLYITGSKSHNCWNSENQTNETLIISSLEVFDIKFTKGMAIFVDLNKELFWYGER